MHPRRRIRENMGQEQIQDSDSSDDNKKRDRAESSDVIEDAIMQH